MLDTKKIIQLGVGVAVGMIAWHFIQKAMNGASTNGETANASGRDCGCGAKDCQGDCRRCCRNVRRSRMALASGTQRRRTTGIGCTEANTPNWSQSMCKRTGGTPNLSIGQYGGCCY